GKETDKVTIDKTNTSLLMEAARRLDEWKVLARKIPGVDAIPVLKTRDVSEPVTLSPPEWNAVMRIDGRRTVEEVARASGSNSFDTAKVLYGLVTAALVEMRARPAEAPRPAARPGAAPAPTSTSTSTSASMSAAASGSAPAA